MAGDRDSAEGAPDRGLAGRTALVTGAARGIGLAIAENLYNHGAQVALADLEGDAVRRAATKLDPGNARAAGFTVDVRQRSALDRVMRDAIDTWGALDIVVNNAAVTSGQPFAEISEEEWDDILAVNLRGVFFGCQIAAEHMRGAGYGRIVNIASNAGQQPNPHVGAHYAAAKAGVIALTKLVALDLAQHGVSVNAVAPAFITGPLMDNLGPDVVETLRTSLPVERLGDPAEVAALVAFLAGPDAGFITGATYDINGGLLMR